MPTINKTNNRYLNIQNLKNVRKKNINVITDCQTSKNENIIRNKSKESIAPIKTNLLSYLNKLPLNSNSKSKNNIIKENNKKVAIPSLHRPKKIGLSKGLSELYKLYVSNDLSTKNVNNSSNKYELYLPNVYARKKGNEKRSNSNSYIASKLTNDKKSISPLNIKV